VVNTLVEKQQLMSRPLREFPQFQSRCHEHSKQWQQDAGPCLDMPAFAHFVTDELYEQGNYQRVHAAFDQMEEFLRDGSQEVRDLVALGFLETLHDVASAKPYGSEAFVRFLGPRTRHVWAGLDAIWRISIRLDLADRSVLEAEVLAWRILRQSLH